MWTSYANRYLPGQAVTFGQLNHQKSRSESFRLVLSTVVVGGDKTCMNTNMVHGHTCSSIHFDVMQSSTNETVMTFDSTTTWNKIKESTHTIYSRTYRWLRHWDHLHRTHNYCSCCKTLSVTTLSLARSIISLSPPSCEKSMFMPYFFQSFIMWPIPSRSFDKYDVSRWYKMFQRRDTKHDRTSAVKYKIPND